MEMTICLPSAHFKIGTLSQHMQSGYGLGTGTGRISSMLTVGLLPVSTSIPASRCAARTQLLRLALSHLNGLTRPISTFTRVRQRLGPFQSIQRVGGGSDFQFFDVLRNRCAPCLCSIHAE